MKLILIENDNPATREPRESKSGLGRSISSGTQSLIATTEHFVDDLCMGLEKELMSGDPLEDYKETEKAHNLLQHDEDDEEETATYSDSMASLSLYSSKISSKISTSSDNNGTVDSSPVVDICANDRDDEIEIDLIKPTIRRQMKELDAIVTSQNTKAFSELELSKTNNPGAFDQDVEVKIGESNGNGEISARNQTKVTTKETSYGDRIEICIELNPSASNNKYDRSQSSKNRALKEFKKAVASASAKGSIAIERKAEVFPPATDARQKIEDERSPLNKSLLNREINNSRMRHGKAIMKQTTKYLSLAKSHYSKKKAKLSRGATTKAIMKQTKKCVSSAKFQYSKAKAKLSKKATTKPYKRWKKEHSTRAIEEVLKHRKAAYMRSLSVIKQIEEDEELKESSDVESMPCVLINVVIDNAINNSFAETNSSCFSDIEYESEGGETTACSAKNVVAPDDVAARNTNRIKPSFLYRKTFITGATILRKSMNIVSKSTRFKKRKKNGNNYQRADEMEDLR